MSENEILDIVQGSLNANQPAGFRVDIVPGEVRHEGRWWYVEVKPSDPQVRSFEFNGVLSDVEQKIEDEHGEYVLLVPELVD